MRILPLLALLPLAAARAEVVDFEGMPIGSPPMGWTIVKTGGGVTVPCATCHGDSLTGLGDVPRLAGMQPVYLARQLISMQNGSSAGTNSTLMKPAVANLSEDDVIAIAAYLGSLPPR